MIENKYPIFGHGQTISKKALDLLRDNPAELTNLMYLDHKDGIITGFDLITDSENKRVIVTKGIVKCGGKIFWMNDNYNFDMPEIENRYILKLKLYSDFEERKFYIRNADFSLEILNNDKSMENQFGEIGKILKERGISEEIRNLFVKILDYYSKYQNNNVKHDSQINEMEVKYIIEQTSIFINFIIDIFEVNKEIIL